MKSHAFHEVILRGLDDLEFAALQLVVYLGGGYLCPFDLHVLTVGYDILESSIHFLQHVTAADEDVLEIGFTCAIHGGSHVDLYATIGGTGETELDAFSQTVLGSLGDGKVTALEDIIEGYRCGLVIFHRNGFTCLRFVVVLMLLGYRVGAGQETFDLDFAVFIGSHILVDTVAGYHERNARYDAVLGGLNDLEVAALERIVKRYGCGLSRYDGYGFCRLRFVAIFHNLGHGVGAGAEIVDLDLAVRSGGYRLIHTVACDGESNAGHLSVLGSLNDLGRAEADLNVQIALDRIVDLGRVSGQVLNTAAGCVYAVRPYHNAFSHRAGLGGCDAYFTGGCGVCSNGQLVSTDREGNAGLIGTKGVVAQYIVGIGQGCGVVRAVPRKLNFLCFGGGFGKETRHLGVLLYTCHHAVVVRNKLTVQRVIGSDTVFYRIVAAGINMVEV